MTRDASLSTPNKKCPYGPAHAHPPRAWIPNKSLRSRTTKPPCNGVDLGVRIMKDMIEARSCTLGGVVWPKIFMLRWLESRKTALLRYDDSTSWMASIPMKSLTQKARAHRIFPRMCGVPASSLVSMSSWYNVSCQR